MRECLDYTRLDVSGSLYFHVVHGMVKLFCTGFTATKVVLYVKRLERGFALVHESPLEGIASLY